VRMCERADVQMRECAKVHGSWPELEKWQ